MVKPRRKSGPLRLPRGPSRRNSSALEGLPHSPGTSIRAVAVYIHDPSRCPRPGRSESQVHINVTAMKAPELAHRAPQRIYCRSAALSTAETPMTIALQQIPAAPAPHPFGAVVSNSLCKFGRGMGPRRGSFHRHRTTRPRKRLATARLRALSCAGVRSPRSRNSRPGRSVPAR